MFNPFAYLRRKAAEAITLGVADGITAVTPAGEEPPADITELRARLAAALEPRALPPAGPAAGEADAEPAKGRAKK